MNWSVSRYEELGSTNEEALARIRRGEMAGCEVFVDLAGHIDLDAERTGDIRHHGDDPRRLAAVHRSLISRPATSQPPASLRKVA